MEETPCCLLHTRRYRSAYEELVNKLTASGPSPHAIHALRERQGRTLCSCNGPLQTLDEQPESSGMDVEQPEPSPASDHGEEEQPSTTVTDLKTSKPAKPGKASTSAGVPPEALDAMVSSLQHRLTTLAAKRGELPSLEPAVVRLPALVKTAMSTPPPPPSEAQKAKIKARAEAKSTRLRALQAILRGSRIRRPRFRRPRFHQVAAQLAKPKPPPKPYAPYRWPPPHITMAAIKGGNPLGAATGQSQSTSRQEQQPQPQADGPLRMGSGELGELLDRADELEEKLHLGRAKRSGAGGAAGHRASGRKGGAASGGLVLRHTRQGGAEGFEIRIQRPEGSGKAGRSRGRDHPNHHRESDKPIVGMFM